MLNYSKRLLPKEDKERLLLWLSQPEFDLLIQCLSDDLSAMQCEYSSAIAKQEASTLAQATGTPNVVVAIKMADLNKSIELLLKLSSGKYEFQKVDHIASR